MKRNKGKKMNEGLEIGQQDEALTQLMGEDYAQEETVLLNAEAYEQEGTVLLDEAAYTSADAGYVSEDAQTVLSDGTEASWEGSYTGDSASYTQSGSYGGRKKKKRYLFPVFAVLILALAVGSFVFLRMNKAQKEEQALSDSLKTCSENVEKGNIQEAIEGYLNLLEAHPESDEAYIGLADAYVAFGDDEMAIEILELGMDTVPDFMKIKIKWESLVTELEDETP